MLNFGRKKTNRYPLWLLAVVILSGICFSPSLLAIPEADHSAFVRRLYIDFVGRPPSTAELQSLRHRLNQAGSENEIRSIIRSVLYEDLIPSHYFSDRLKDYFNGLFGMDIRHGRLLPRCNDNQSAGCVDDKTAMDFRDEIAMFIARTIVGTDRDKSDVRDIVTSSYTNITPRMARALLNDATLISRVGMEHLDTARLEAIAETPAMASWHPIDRDPDHTGVQAAGNDHREYHSGVLTSPGFLLRSTMHISRANYFYSWFLCREADQTEAAASYEVKLAERKPCSGCHAILEPLGSFWVYWRAGIDADELEQSWILDGVSRVTGDDQPSPLTGAIPLDNEDEIHSRTAEGMFRGNKGKGVAAIGSIGIKDDDFPRCMSQHAWQFLLSRPLNQNETGWVRLLGERLVTDYEWDLREVLVDIVLSPSYFSEM